MSLFISSKRDDVKSFGVTRHGCPKKLWYDRKKSIKGEDKR